MRPITRVLATLIVLVLAGASSGAAGEKKKTLTEAQKIDALIASVEQLKDARFIRNGSEHDGTAAADHMRRKRKAAGDRVKTAREFIDQIASKSSRSGDPYRIKFKDGKETTSGAFLSAELTKLEK